MGCKLTSNITKENCQYSIAGIRAIYLLNYDSTIDYTFGANGGIETITLPADSNAYKVDFIEGTASFTDDLAVNGNGGKYRTQTVNFTVSEYDYNILNEGDALSLGKFIAVIVDKSNRCIALGRNNGLSATSFNYASGAADADANGWAAVLAGTEIEIARLVKDESVITALVKQDVTITE